jgi:hypothetical protein
MARLGGNSILAHVNPLRCCESVAIRIKRTGHTLLKNAKIQTKTHKMKVLIPVEDEYLESHSTSQVSTSDAKPSGKPFLFGSAAAIKRLSRL